MGRLWVGTSGWLYPEWYGIVYPGRPKKDEAFTLYRKRFDSVELNSTFYHFPQKSTVEKWEALGGEDFTWSVKAWRWLTHIKCLKAPASDFNSFFSRTAPLTERKGVVLFQLPPSMKQDLQRLESFLKKVRDRVRVAVEFRHNSWFAPDTYEVLRSSGAALVGVDAPGITRVLDVRTAPFAYFRLHGSSQWYSHNYSKKELEVFAKAAARHLKEGDVYVYFDNTAGGDAFHNAETLREILKKSVHRRKS
jgi:uncharacterized protein YecE (DUF72 family)